MNTMFKNIYPKQIWTNSQINNNYDFPNCSCPNNHNDERFGGFLLPFVAGAAISAPFWLAAGNNRPQNNFYPYLPQQYPYYPVYMNNNYPMPNPQFIKNI